MTTHDRECHTWIDPENRGWCAPTWISIHSKADSLPGILPRSVAAAFWEYMNREAEFLPCSVCSQHLKQELAHFPLPLSSDTPTVTGEQVSKWVIDLHNRVNKRLGHRVLSDREAMDAQKFARSLNWGKVLQDAKKRLDNNANKGGQAWRDETESMTTNIHPLSPLTSRRMEGKGSNQNWAIAALVVAVLLVVLLVLNSQRRGNGE